MARVRYNFPMPLSRSLKFLVLSLLVVVLIIGGVAALRSSQLSAGIPEGVVIPTLNGEAAELPKAPFLATLVSNGQTSVHFFDQDESGNGFVVSPETHTLFFTSADTPSMTMEEAVGGPLMQGSSFWIYEYPEDYKTGGQAGFTGRFGLSEGLLGEAGDQYESLNTPGMTLKPGRLYYLRLMKGDPAQAGQSFGVSTADTDNDGLSDGFETGYDGRVDVGDSDPRNSDSDGDGRADGEDKEAGGSTCKQGGGYCDECQRQGLVCTQYPNGQCECEQEDDDEPICTGVFCDDCQALHQGWNCAERNGTCECIPPDDGGGACTYSSDCEQKPCDCVNGQQICYQMYCHQGACIEDTYYPGTCDDGGGNDTEEPACTGVFCDDCQSRGQGWNCMEVNGGCECVQIGGRTSSF